MNQDLTMAPALKNSSDALKSAHTAFNAEVDAARASIYTLQQKLFAELSGVAKIEQDVKAHIGLAVEKIERSGFWAVLKRVLWG